MKENFKKYCVPILVVVSVVVACIVTVVIFATKSRTTNVTNQDCATSAENSTTADKDENSTTDDATVDTGENITNNQWIVLFAEKFGLSSYTNETPYYENIKADDTIFPYVQTMVENENLLCTTKQMIECKSD